MPRYCDMSRRIHEAAIAVREEAGFCESIQKGYSTDDDIRKSIARINYSAMRGRREPILAAVHIDTIKKIHVAVCEL